MFVIIIKTEKTKQKEVREKCLNSKSRTGTHMRFANNTKQKLQTYIKWQIIKNNY